ncbi:hypothetical protein J6590_080283 [Homalodisca vitripennis]|nr:hypothetical protein J6590_080283 [Homalodisca vitripennis]
MEAKRRYSTARTLQVAFQFGGADRAEATDISALRIGRERVLNGEHIPLLYPFMPGVVTAQDVSPKHKSQLSALSRADPVRRTHWTGIVTLPGVTLFHEGQTIPQIAAGFDQSGAKFMAISSRRAGCQCLTETDLQSRLDDTTDCCRFCSVGRNIYDDILAPQTIPSCCGFAQSGANYGDILAPCWVSDTEHNRAEARRYHRLLPVLLSRAQIYGDIPAPLDDTAGCCWFAIAHKLWRYPRAVLVSDTERHRADARRYHRLLPVLLSRAQIYGDILAPLDDTAGCCWFCSVGRKIYGDILAPYNRADARRYHRSLPVLLNRVQYLWRYPRPTIEPRPDDTTDCCWFCSVGRSIYGDILAPCQTIPQIAAGFAQSGAVFMAISSRLTIEQMPDDTIDRCRFCSVGRKIYGDILAPCWVPTAITIFQSYRYDRSMGISISCSTTMYNFAITCLTIKVIESGKYNKWKN